MALHSSQCCSDGVEWCQTWLTQCCRQLPHQGGRYATYRQIVSEMSSVSVKIITPCDLRFSDIFHKRLRVLNQFFTHLLYVPIYVRLQIFIHLSQTLTKLCHIKRYCLFHIICSKCPPSAETHAFRRLRESLIALLIVVCGKSSQICCFYNVNKHARYDMMSTVTSFAH